MEFNLENAQKFLELQKQKRKKHLEELSNEQKVKVDDLKKISDDLTKLQKEFDEEFKKLEQKYSDLKAPLFKTRSEIVNESKDGQFTGVPNFWFFVLKNSEVFADIMSKRDEDALKYLQDVVSTSFEDEKEEGFHLDFHFRENPYFENKVLRKTFTESKTTPPSDSYPKGTKIDWKKDQNLTVEVVTKKKKHKGGGKTKTVKKTQPCESFFNFFNDTNPDDLEEEDLQMFNETLEADMECGEMLKEEIIPNAIAYYLGDADSVNPLSGMMGGMEEGEGDEDDDEEEGGVKFEQPKGGKGEKDAECEKQQQ